MLEDKVTDTIHYDVNRKRETEVVKGCNTASPRGLGCSRGMYGSRHEEVGSFAN